MASPQLDAFLNDLKPSSLHLVGGAAVVAAYGGRRCSPELDVPAAEAAALPAGRPGSELHRRHGLCLRPAAPFLPPDWRRRCVPVARNVWAAGREDLVISKAARYLDQDRADIALVIADCDRLELIRRYRSARRLYKGDLRVLDNSFNAVLREFLGLGPFRF